MKEQLEKQFTEQTGGNVYYSGGAFGFGHSGRYVQWLEKRVFRMNELSSKESREMMKGFDAIELMRKTT
jgi:hypothetical protein